LWNWILGPRKGVSWQQGLTWPKLSPSSYTTHSKHLKEDKANIFRKVDQDKETLREVLFESK